MPMVIETSVGVDRTALALLCNAYAEEELADGETRTVLRLPRRGRADQGGGAAALEEARRAGAAHRRASCAARWNVFYDEAGNIGRRYRRQDEVGTPFCVTFDFESERDGKVTVRERDSMTPGAHRDRRRGRRYRRASGCEATGVTAAGERGASERRRAPRAGAARRRRVYFFGDGRADGRAR